MRTLLLALSILGVSCASEKGLTVYNSDPNVTIFSPADGSEHISGEVVTFMARIGDDRDDPAALVRIWSSDVQGQFADLSAVSAMGDVEWSTATLDLGDHLISLQVVDADGLTSTDTVGVSVVLESGDDTGGTGSGVDQDGDGYDASVDCDDLDSQINPGAEEYPYDGVDQDCDGEDLTDQDGDGHDAVVAGGDDCEDTDAGIFPGAEEFCDDADNDCDGTVDEPDAVGCATWWLDADSDGYGSDTTACLCGPSGDYTADNNDDCLDTDPEVNPGHTDFEVSASVDGVWDWDCNGVIEQQWTDVGRCEGTLFCEVTVGWLDAIPACGTLHSWVVGCSGGTCSESSVSRTQACR